VTSPPFVPSSGPAKTALGAVGGARGVGAGALRLIIEFLTTFNPEAIKQVEAEIQRLTALQKQADADLNALSQTRLALQGKLNQARNAGVVLDRKQVETINQLGAKYANIGKLTGTALQQQIALRDAEVKQIALATGLDERDILALSQKKQLQIQIDDYLDLEVAKRKEIAALNRQIATQQAELNNIQRAGNIGPGLASLGIGAIGAAAGFAVLGPLLSGVSEWMDKIVQSAMDLIDPSKKAAEALKSVAEQVDAIADRDSISRLEAAKKLIDEIRTPTGTALTLGAPELNPELAENAALNAKIAESLKSQLDLMRSQIDSTIEIRKNAADILALRMQQNGLQNPFDPLFVTTNLLLGNVAGVVGQQRNFNDVLDQTINQTEELNLADERRKQALAAQEAILKQQQADLQSLLSDAMSASVNNAVDASINQLNASLQRTIDLYDAAEDRQVSMVQGGLEHTIDAIQERAKRQVDSLQARLDKISNVGPSARTKALQKALEDLANVGPSQHTKDLEAALQRLSDREEKRQYQNKLADIARERSEIILKRQLELQKSAIDIDRYHGRDRLIAIDAELSRQAKANEAQARYNKLLEIQYQFTRRLTREQGETIQEFEERRGQRNRDLLEQAAELRQKDSEDDLNDEKDKTQYKIDLAENAAKRQETIRQRDLQLQQRALQASLAKSKQHDKDVLDSQKKALQARLKASQDADRLELDRRRKAIQAQIQAVQDGAQKDMESARRAAQFRIDEIHRAFDEARDKTRQAVQDTIDAERERAQNIIRFSQLTEVARLQSGIQGAHNIAELNTIAGWLAGSNYSDAYIRAQLTVLGVDPYTAGQILGNIDQTRDIYNNKLRALSQFSYQSSGHFAKGGFVELTNGMNFGQNAHFGEEGSELAYVLSNKMSQAFKQNRQEPMIGTVNLTTQKPSRDMYYLRRTIREVVREEVR
jgi:hypothetical protein